TPSVSPEFKIIGGPVSSNSIYATTPGEHIPGIDLASRASAPPDRRLGLPPDRRRTRMRHRMINKTSKINATPFEAYQPH
ncbi:hypothetical protein, partial [Ralstonia pseudosolanacearum]|uniref:hypothetical protein n=1 Tax=Ralstonia pseudosolanacearum TaxID=1310165 RepID=UPI0026764CC7